MTDFNKTTNKNGGEQTSRPDLYFFDCEFNEVMSTDASSPFYDIDFISIAVVNEKGDLYYAVNQNFDLEKANEDEWLKKHVIAKLPPQSEWKPVNVIRDELIDFFDEADSIELWARQNSYDVVSFCRLFGTMMSMRETFNEKGIRSVKFRDINEFKHDPDVDFSLLDKKDETQAHGADYDADFERRLYQQIMAIKAKKSNNCKI